MKKQWKRRFAVGCTIIMLAESILVNSVTFCFDSFAEKVQVSTPSDAVKLPEINEKESEEKIKAEIISQENKSAAQNSQVLSGANVEMELNLDEPLEEGKEYVYRTPDEWENVLIYTIKNGEITIIDCEETARGDVVVPASIQGLPVTTIGEKAFQKCQRKTVSSIVISDGIKYIKKNAFTVDDKDLDLDSLLNVSRVKISLPDTIIEIEPLAFCNVYAEELNIPKSLSVIPVKAFEQARIDEIIIPKNIIKIETGAFTCAGIEKLTIENPDIILEAQCFWGCAYLNSINFPNGINHLGVYNFGCCSRLKEVNIPSGVINLPSGIFIECRMLETVSLREGIESLDSRCFESCSKLNNFYIPKSVKSIGERAFNECVGLKDIYYGGSMTDWSRMSIGANNDELLNAHIHYNCTIDFDGTIHEGPQEQYSSTISLNGNIYQLFYGLEYSAAKRYCESISGHLATINSKNENEFLWSYLKKNNVDQAYFGFSNADDKETWKWVTDEEISYTNWSDGEPNEETEKNYAMFNGSSMWNVGSGEANYFICEWDNNKITISPKTGSSFFPRENQLTFTIPGNYTIGSGICFLRNYKDDSIVKQIEFDENAVSYSEEKNNTVIYSMVLNDLPPNMHLYFSMEEDTFKNSDTNQSEYIAPSKDEWSIYTQRDVWKFENDYYNIPDWMFWELYGLKGETILRILSNGRVGVCEGMVGTAMTFDQNLLNASDFIQKTLPNMLYDVEKEAIHNDIGLSAIEYIQLGHALQFKPYFEQQKYRNKTVGKEPNKEHNKLNDLLEKVRYYELTRENPICITVDKNGKDRHALWAYGTREDDNCVEILIYDCNEPNHDNAIRLEGTSPNFSFWNYVSHEDYDNITYVEGNELVYYVAKIIKNNKGKRDKSSKLLVDDVLKKLDDDAYDALALEKTDGTSFVVSSKNGMESYQNGNINGNGELIIPIDLVGAANENDSQINDLFYIDTTSDLTINNTVQENNKIMLAKENSALEMELLPSESMLIADNNGYVGLIFDSKAEQTRTIKLSTIINDEIMDISISGKPESNTQILQESDKIIFKDLSECDITVSYKGHEIEKHILLKDELQNELSWNETVKDVQSDQNLWDAFFVNDKTLDENGSNEKPDNPENPDNPDNPEKPENPDTPDNPNKPDNTNSDKPAGSSHSGRRSSSSGGEIKSLVSDLVTRGSWVKDISGWWFELPDHSWLSNGWYQLSYNGNNDWYYFDVSGYMATGWIEDNGYKYYLNPVSDGSQGRMITGWYMIDGKWYYFNPVSDGTKGKMAVNTYIDSYYVGEDGVWVVSYK